MSFTPLIGFSLLNRHHYRHPRTGARFGEPARRRRLCHPRASSRGHQPRRSLHLTGSLRHRQRAAVGAGDHERAGVHQEHEGGHHLGGLATNHWAVINLSRRPHRLASREKTEHILSVKKTTGATTASRSNSHGAKQATGSRDPAQRAIGSKPLRRLRRARSRRRSSSSKRGAPYSASGTREHSGRASRDSDPCLHRGRASSGCPRQ